MQNPGDGSGSRPLVTLLIRNAEQVVTAEPGPDPAYGWYPLRIHRGAAVACSGTEIVAVGPTEEVAAATELSPAAVVLDAVGCVVTPGLVDCHTHPVFAGSRLDEFEARLRGSSYEEIAASGGGIRATVRATRQASEEELLRTARCRLKQFLSFGITTLEAKSGYGLSLEDELKILRVVRRLGEEGPVGLVPTFLGAHEIPDEFRSRREQYIELLVNEMIPRVAEEGLARFCDVFCEQGVFEAAEAERILLRAREVGLLPKIHAEQLSRNGGSKVAARVSAVSADHLDWCEQEDLLALRDAGVVPVVLPGAVFFLGKERYASARAMVDLGMPVAVSTDFNPGSSPLYSLPMAAALACLKQGLTPAEAMVAMTLGGAWALRLQERIGTLEPGKQADAVVWPVGDYREILYHMGVIRPRWVIREGRVVAGESVASS